MATIQKTDSVTENQSAVLEGGETGIGTETSQGTATMMQSVKAVGETGSLIGNGTRKVIDMDPSLIPKGTELRVHLETATLLLRDVSIFIVVYYQEGKIMTLSLI